MATFDGADEKTIQVRFKTKEAEFAVTEKPFAVPERLTRLGLSQVINHLLDRGTSAKQINNSVELFKSFNTCQIIQIILINTAIKFLNLLYVNYFQIADPDWIY